MTELQRKRVIVVNYDFTHDFLPQIMLRSLDDDRDRQIQLSSGDSLDWSFLPEKFCIGYHTLEKGHSYLPCPNRTPIPLGIQCEKCRMSDSLSRCIYCNGSECHASQSVKDQCSDIKSSVYLAAFGMNLKVGVSSKDRLLKRWLEQGADQAVEVASVTSGKMARIVEHHVSKEFLISKSIRTKAKIERILDKHSTCTRLEDLAIKASRWIEEHYPECAQGEMEIVDLRNHYNLSFASAPFAYTISNEFTISGKFIAMKGPLFFFQDKIAYFLDFRSLRGRRVIIKQPAEEGQSRLTNWPISTPDDSDSS